MSVMHLHNYHFFSCFPFQWIPELKHYAPGVPIVLVGTKLGMILTPWIIVSFYMLSIVLFVNCYWFDSL